MIIYHQKVIIFPQECALIPQNRSFNHIYLKFSLSKMIDTLKSKNATSRICALLWAKFARMPELGGGEGEPQPLPYPTRGRGGGWRYGKGIGRAILLLLVTVGEYVP